MLEEGKKDVIIRKIAGTQHENRFYPDFSGVGTSYNIYSLSTRKSTEGIISAAPGLGKTVVDGLNTVRFCPCYPADRIQFYSVEGSLSTTQRRFYVFQPDASSEFGYETHDMMVKLVDAYQSGYDASK